MSLKILVVDDNPICRQVLIDLLTDKGWQVATAENGIQALQKCKDKKFNAVITGFYMPVVDGPHFLRMLKEMEELAQLPVIMLSTQEQKEVEAQVDFQLLSLYLRKPLNCDTKRQLVDHLSTLAVATDDKAA